MRKANIWLCATGLGLSVLMLPAAPAAAAVAGISTPVAMLYAYETKDQKAFEAGYKAHLAWHADKQDHLVWYAWYVIAGARTGLFVDGTFGSVLPDIDRRPALAEDAAHFRENAAPFSTPRSNDVYALWLAVSTATLLEERQPSRMQDVVFLTLDANDASRFERGLEKLAMGGKNAASRINTGLPITWYRTLIGGEDQGYMLILPRDSWAEIGHPRADLAGIAAAAYGVSRVKAAEVFAPVRAIRSETWVYRSDLSYFPGQ